MQQEEQQQGEGGELRHEEAMREDTHGEEGQQTTEEGGESERERGARVRVARGNAGGVRNAQRY